MESLGLRFGGNPLSFPTTEDHESRLGLSSSSHHRRGLKMIARACLIAANGRSSPSSSSSKTISTSYLSLPPSPASPIDMNLMFDREEMCGFGFDEGGVGSSGILEEWVKNSISEIVRNIGEAPFLMHVYSNNKGKVGSSSPRLEIEKEEAVTDSWPRIRRRWKQGNPMPDGVILVEQIDNGGDGNANSNLSSLKSHSTERTWGLLVQGRGVDYAACYILKTCRVRSSLGFCTHFCLVRANCFGDTAELQLRDSWIASR
ncbi:hypothetical protein GIB67_035106 [Kingdonia uniflora]|uniref:DUF7804 domain-containing protein n=1 Tax=Kingdonia uniflora TaxID=39325 RepID=A0A7J7NBP6_9MAGN|nr:hypothetical protein GIB67_035106 [Kingdonia uniflora]